VALDWGHTVIVVGTLCLAASGCLDIRVIDPCDAEDAYSSPAYFDATPFCDGDLVKSRRQCTYNYNTYVAVDRDCDEIGARCRSGKCVSRKEGCPKAHQSFCDAGAVRNCVGNAVEVDANACGEGLRCVEGTDLGVTRALCALSDVPCSRAEGECDGNTLVTCESGFPLSRKECSGVSCVEPPDSEGAACLSPACEPGFWGWVCDDERIVQCEIGWSGVQADCAAENKHCVMQGELPFCSATEELPTTLEWLQIPGGMFTVQGESFEQSVDLAGFEMLAHEVTFPQYQICVNAGECGLVTVSEREQFDANLPIASLLVADAKQFCAWAGGRLPDQTEWQYVATNLGTTRFPWGDAPASCALSVLGCRGSAAEVCSTPGDRTALGVCDLAGNVSELVGIPGFPRSNYALGGNFETPTGELSLLIPESKDLAVDWYPFAFTGFRCVR